MNPSRVSETIEDWLRRNQLGQYTDAIKKYGYSSLEVLAAATEADLDKMAADPAVGMKKPHLRLLKQQWTRLKERAERDWERAATAAAIEQRQKKEGYVSYPRGAYA